MQKIIDEMAKRIAEMPGVPPEEARELAEAVLAGALRRMK